MPMSSGKITTPETNASLALALRKTSVTPSNGGYFFCPFSSKSAYGLSDARKRRFYGHNTEAG